jgi:hypothetical protein
LAPVSVIGVGPTDAASSECVCLCVIGHGGGGCACDCVSYIVSLQLLCYILMSIWFLGATPIHYVVVGATPAIRLCNSYLGWLDGVPAPPNLVLVLNVQVKSVLTRTCRLDGQWSCSLQAVSLVRDLLTQLPTSAAEQFSVAFGDVEAALAASDVLKQDVLALEDSSRTTLLAPALLLVGPSVEQVEPLLSVSLD